MSVNAATIPLPRLEGAPATVGRQSPVGAPLVEIELQSTAASPLPAVNSNEPKSPLSNRRGSIALPEPELAVDMFEYSEGLTSTEATRRLAQFGPNALPEHHVSKLYLFFSQLWQPMPVMIWLAIIIEIAIYNWTDMGILLFIQFANASIGCARRNRCPSRCSRASCCLVACSAFTK